MFVCTQMDVFLCLFARWGYYISHLCVPEAREFLPLWSRWDRAAHAFPVRKTERREVVIQTRHIPPARLNQCERIFEKCQQYQSVTTSNPSISENPNCEDFKIKMNDVSCTAKSWALFHMKKGCIWMTYLLRQLRRKS